MTSKSFKKKVKSSQKTAHSLAMPASTTIHALLDNSVLILQQLALFIVQHDEMKIELEYLQFARKKSEHKQILVPVCDLQPRLTTQKAKSADEEKPVPCISKESKSTASKAIDEKEPNVAKSQPDGAMMRSLVSVSILHRILAVP